MKTRILLPFAVVAVAVAGCGSSGSSNNSGSPQASTSATATNAQTAGGKLDARDKDFVIKSQQGALFEVEAGKLALKNASSKQAKSFAQQMIKDHSTEAQALSKVAAPLGVKLPPKPDNTEIKEIQTISKYKGHRFDVAYLRLEIGDHRDDIQGDHKETSEGVNPKVKGFAVRFATMYRRHLKLALSDQKQIGGQT